MFKVGICNELFEGQEFGPVCRLVKTVGYDGLEIAPFTLAGLITELSAARRRELRAMVEDAGLETIGLHWLLAKTEGLYLTSPEESVRRATGDYLVALAEATRDLGGSLMVLGSPKQRNLLPGVSHEQAVGYALDVFHRIMPAIGAAGVDLCFEPLAPNDTDFINTCEQGAATGPAGWSSSFQAAHGREGPEQRARSVGSGVDPQVREGRRAFSCPGRESARAGDGAGRLRADHAGACRIGIQRMGFGRGL